MHLSDRKISLSPLNAKADVVNRTIAWHGPIRKKVCIYGAGLGRREAPLDDPSWYVYALNLVPPFDRNNCGNNILDGEQPVTRPSGRQAGVVSLGLVFGLVILLVILLYWRLWPTMSLTTPSGTNPELSMIAPILKPMAWKAACKERACRGAVSTEWTMIPIPIGAGPPYTPVLTGVVLHPPARRVSNSWTANAPPSASPPTYSMSISPLSGDAFNAATSCARTVGDRRRGATSCCNWSNSRSAFAARSCCSAAWTSSLPARSLVAAASTKAFAVPCCASADLVFASAMVAADSALNLSSAASLAALTRAEKYHTAAPASAASTPSTTTATWATSDALSSDERFIPPLWLVVSAASVLVLSGSVIIHTILWRRRNRR